MSELLHGLWIREDKIVIAVTSAGCTQPEHFRIDVSGPENEPTVSIVRTQPDLCRMMPHVIEIELRLPDGLLSTSFQIQNAFRQGPFLAVPEGQHHKNP